MNGSRGVGLLGLMAGLAALGGCMTADPNLPPLSTVASVDLQRYAGKWYEIASYPVSFQEGCTGTTAEYTLRDDGRVTVFNRCFQDSLSGPANEIRGSARVPNPDESAKLKVSFFWPFEGDYWVIDLDEANYSWAVVGVPSRQMLWILSRTPQLDDAIYNDILTRLPGQGYDVSKLRRTEQPQQ